MQRVLGRVGWPEKAWIEIVERGVQGKSFKEKLTGSGGAEQTHEDFFLVICPGVYVKHIYLRQ